MIKTILFDLGGVIITLDQAEAIRRFREIGLSDAEQRLNAYTQSGIFGDLEMGLIDAEEFRSRLSALMGNEVTYEQCLYAWKGYVGDVPMRNLLTLRKLRTEGFRIVLLSNTNPYMMSWALSSEFDGKGQALDYYIDDAYLSYKCRMMKPDECFFRYVIEKEGVSPDNLLFVDDGLHNVENAASLGIKTFQPENGSDWTNEIYKYLNQ